VVFNPRRVEERRSEEPSEVEVQKVDDVTSCLMTSLPVMMTSLPVLTFVNLEVT